MSSAPVPEIAWFTSSEAYQKDASIANTSLALVGSAEGMRGTYRGPYVEEPTTEVWINVWESLDAHLAFRKSPSYPELVEGVKVFFASKPEMVHANLTTPCERALSAPATEIAFITLQEGSTKEELDPLVVTLEAELAKAPGSHGSSWGWSVEKEGVYVGVVGWDSVAAHIDAVKAAPLDTVIQQIKKIANVALKHAHLAKFKN